MNIWGKIKQLLKRIKNETPSIEEPKKSPDSLTNNSFDDWKPLAKRMHVSKEDLKEIPVTFEDLEPEVITELIKSLGGHGELYGETHSGPVKFGKIHGNGFVALERRNPRNGHIGRTICTNDSYYDIQVTKTDLTKGSYRECHTLDDGTKTNFNASLGKEGGLVFNSATSKNGVEYREIAMHPTIYGDTYCFDNYAQPSEEYSKEYAIVTGLPIIMDSKKRNEMKEKTGIPVDDLTGTMREKIGKTPYVTSIEAIKWPKNGTEFETKSVRYAYSSYDAYEKGDYPNMIHIEGIGDRKGPSGMFRRLGNGDIYVDNSTFGKKDGIWTYDTMTFKQIKKLVENDKMPTALSERVDLASKGKFRMPSEVQKIFDATTVKMQKESPNKGKEIVE